MDLQNKISKLSTSSNYVSNVQINNRIKELLLHELKCKQKITNKELNKSKLKQKKKKKNTDQDYQENKEKHQNETYCFLHVTGN